MTTKERTHRKGLCWYISDRALGWPIPWWLGFGWREITVREDVFFPIPLNWMMRWLRGFYFLLRMPRRSWWEKREGRIEGVVREEERQYWKARNRMAEEAAYQMGWRDCREAILRLYGGEDEDSLTPFGKALIGREAVSEDAGTVYEMTDLTEPAEEGGAV